MTVFESFSGTTRAKIIPPRVEMLDQFGLMQFDELVEERELLRLQTGLAENLEPDWNLPVGKPFAALEKAHIAFIFGRGVHHHNLLIVATQRGEIGTD